MHCCARTHAAASASASASPTPAAAAASSSSSSASAASSARRPGVGVTVTILRESPLSAEAVAAASSPLTTSTTRPTTEWQVLLVRRSKAPMAGWWALPGGSIELGETIQRAAIRETKEETNLRVAVKMAQEPFLVTQYIENAAATPAAGVHAAETPAADAPADPAAATAAAPAAAAGSPPSVAAHFILLHMLADPLEGSALSAARAGDDAAELRWFPAARVSDMVRQQQIAANQSRSAQGLAQPQHQSADVSAALQSSPSSSDPIIPSVARVVREGLMKRREQIAAKAAAETAALTSRVTNAAGGVSAVQPARRIPAAGGASDKAAKGGGKPGSKRAGGAKSWEHPAKHPGATPWPRAQRDAMKQRKREKRAADATTDAE